jgi:hypothetical protein
MVKRETKETEVSLDNDWDSRQNIVKTNILKKTRNSISQSLKNSKINDFQKEKSEIFIWYKEVISIIENEKGWEEFLLSIDNKYKSITEEDIEEIGTLLFNIYGKIVCWTNMTGKWDVIVLSKIHNIEIPRRYEKLIENTIEKTCLILYHWNIISLDTIKELYIKEGASDYEGVKSSKNFLAYLARLRFWEELNKDRKEAFTLVHFTTDQGLEDIIRDQSIKALGANWVYANLSSDWWLTWWQWRIYGIIPEKLNEELRRIKKNIDSKWYDWIQSTIEFENAFDWAYYDAGLQKLPKKAISFDIQLNKVGIAPDLIERWGFDSYIYWTEKNEEFILNRRDIESYKKKAPLKSWKMDYLDNYVGKEKIAWEHEDDFYRVPRGKAEIKFKKVKNIQTFTNYKDAIYFIAKRLDKDFRNLFCKKMIWNNYNSREVDRL